MLSSFSGNAVLAKVKAMYGKRLCEKNYKELVHKRSVAEIASYLKTDTPYSTVLETVQPGQVHRGQLESVLREDRFLKYARLVRFAPESQKDYYGYLFTGLEIQQILQVLRLMIAGKTEDFLLQVPFFTDRYTCFDLEKLVGVKTFDDLMCVLDKTPYVTILLPFRPALGKIDYPRAEFAMRSYYFAHIYELVEKGFSGTTKEQLIEIWDHHVELTNLINIYRLKTYYNAAAEQIAPILLLTSQRTPSTFMEELLHAPDSATFLELLAKSKYSGRADKQNKDEIVWIEYSADSIRCRLCRRRLRFTTDGAVAFTSFMVLSDIEIMNLVSIIEGVKYELDPDAIEKLLIKE